MGDDLKCPKLRRSEGSVDEVGPEPVRVHPDVHPGPVAVGVVRVVVVVGLRGSQLPS